MDNLSDKWPQMATKLVKELAGALAAGGALDIVVLDSQKVVDWTDYLIIATFTSERHGFALLDSCGAILKEQGLTGKLSSANKQGENDWLLLDAGEVVINLFNAERRAFYNLEELWANAEKLSLSN